MKKITSNDISVVVQGAINKPITFKCLKNLRKYLPKSEIILSSWENSDISGLEKYCDKIVLNKDPGAPFDNFIQPNKYNFSEPNNLNRQIVSTKEGLKQATGKYILKFRTDFILYNIDFIKKYNEIETVAKEKFSQYQVFKNRILTIGCGNPYKMGMAYHLSDLIAFGTAEDVKKLWDIEPIDKDFCEWGTKNQLYKAHYFNMQYTHEQYLLLNALDKAAVNYKKPYCYFDLDDEMITDTEKIFLSNFILATYKYTGIYTKFENMNRIDDGFGYQFNDFVCLYEKYFGKNKKLRNLEKKTNPLRKKIFFFYTNGHELDLSVFFIKIHISHKNNYILFDNKSIKKHKNIFIDGFGNIVEINGKVNLSGIKIKIWGNDNRVVIENNNINLNNVFISIQGNKNTFRLDENCHCIQNTQIWFPNFYENRKITIGKNAMIMGANIYNEENNNKIIIGDDITASTDITIYNSDGHVLYDDDRQILNRGKEIVVGNNCFLARKVTLLKGSRLSDNTVVGYGAVVTKEFSDKNCIIAGMPATLKKRNINFTRQQFNQYFADIKVGKE